MATLFFDGFDRGTTLGRLDPQYWSTQYKNDPGYAFGGYGYNQGVGGYAGQYKTISINNGTLPSGSFTGPQTIATNGGWWRWGVPGNYYPAFGSPPGFLCLSNVPINDLNFLAPLTYIQLSGFPQPQSNKTYFGARFLGLETKHTDYDSRVDPSRTDKPGRFDYRHPLLAFCSGTTTGLLLSIVKATGNNLQLLDNQKMTMGLQVEQNGQILGIFDLNLNDTINQYKVSSIYNNYVAGGTLSDISGRVLSIVDIRTEGAPGGCNNCNNISSTTLVSRWTHLEFLLDNNGINSSIAAKIEGVDIPVIDPDDTNSDKETWVLEIPMSGFNYDNIRFFNRTYYKDLYSDWFGDPSNSLYYGKGNVTLIDDVTLIDTVGQPGFWLGPSAKVLPLSPGIQTNVDNNGVISDGLREWSTNSSSHRTALKNYDGDIGIIETATSGAVTAVRFDNHNFGGDPYSVWRTAFNDGIAGMKVYNTARKNFLDTKFVNVFFTGVADSQAQYTQLLLNTNRDIYDVTNKNAISKIQPISLSYDNKKFNDPSIAFPTTDSYLYTSYGDLYQTEAGPGNPYPPPNNFFTIESWVYFPNGSETITLYGKKPPSSYPQIAGLRLDIPSANFDIVCTTGYLQYGTYIDDVLLSYRRLYFPTPIATGTWNHVALVNDAVQDFRGTLNGNTRYYNHQYRLIAYLNGISGTSYSVQNNLDTNLTVYTTNNNPFEWAPDYNSYSNNNLDFGPGISGLKLNYASENLSGLGNNTSPLSGLLQNYFPSIKVPVNSHWSDRINYPTTILASGWRPELNGTYNFAGFINGKPYWYKPDQGSSIFSNGSQWCMGPPDYRGCGWVTSTSSAIYPPKDSWSDIASGGSMGKLIYSLPMSNMNSFSISETRCNNQLAYMVTSAALPEITGLYCYGGIFNNAYYYLNIDNPTYYLCNPYWYPWNESNANRRWIISSGLIEGSQIGSNSYAKYVCDSASPSGETLVSVQSLYTAHLRVLLNTNNQSNSTFTVYKNSIQQYGLSRNTDGLLSGVIPVTSGDVISILQIYNTYPNISLGKPSVTVNLALSSSTQTGLYTLPTEWVSTQQYWWQGNMPYITRVKGIVGKFTDNYTSTSSSDNNFPLFIGGGGYIDNYRFTHGTSRTEGVQSRTRYNGNFTVSNEPFPSVYSDYYELGEDHNLTKTRYNTIQYFAMNNPATQQPWNLSLIETSGFLFGVKKL